MSTALRVKFDIQGLDRSAAIAVIEEATMGEDWKNGFTFSDGSSMSAYFDVRDGVERCVFHWYDQRGERPNPAVRARFTCCYFENEDSVEAFYDGSILCNYPLPYFTLSDMEKLMQKEWEVRMVFRDVYLRHISSTERVFEILAPGLDRGEHITAEPFLLDLGTRVIEVYTISGLFWEWMPFYSEKLLDRHGGFTGWFPEALYSGAHLV